MEKFQTEIKRIQKNANTPILSELRSILLKSLFEGLKSVEPETLIKNSVQISKDNRSEIILSIKDITRSSIVNYKIDLSRINKIIMIGGGKATGAMVKESINAATKLEEENIHCEVIDPRTLVPLDKKTILNSVEKTGKLLIVDEGCKTCSVSAEIAAIVAEEGFKYLKKNIIRLNTPDVPIPYSQKLEKEIIPNTKSIQDNVKKLI